MISLSSLPNVSNNILEISRELLETPEKGNQQPSLNYKELKEDNDYLIYEDGKLFSNSLCLKNSRFSTSMLILYFLL